VPVFIIKDSHALKFQPALRQVDCAIVVHFGWFPGCRLAPLAEDAQANNKARLCLAKFSCTTSGPGGGRHKPDTRQPAERERDLERVQAALKQEAMRSAAG
jgi:hypothetical protein